MQARLWHRCFPVNFVKFLRTPFSQNNSGRLLLKVKDQDDNNLGIDLEFAGEINTYLNLSFCYHFVFKKLIFRMDLTYLFEILSCHLHFCRVIWVFLFGDIRVLVKTKDSLLCVTNHCMKVLRFFNTSITVLFSVSRFYSASKLIMYLLY